MPYTVKDYRHLLGISGLSNQLLENHFTLYAGYVTNTNKLAETLKALLGEGKGSSPEYAELKRRFGWEFNGMRLHEYYFDNLTKAGAPCDKGSRFYQKILEDYGSFEDWEKDFRAIAGMRGIGWVILYYDPQAHCLFNTWINEHDMGHLSGATPLLVLDVFEHAFMLDYGLKRADYITTILRAIDWGRVIQRFEQAAAR